MISLDLLVRAYQAGLFPMGLEDGQIGWFSPDPRGIIPLDAFHVPTRLARVVRQRRFTTSTDREFDQVIRACARTTTEGTWISDEIRDTYAALHHQGLAHSVEVWRGDELVGGLYGVALQRAFFGESMFSRETDASKVALVALVDHLRARDYQLLDIQWVTPHLARFGALEIPRRRYMRLLAEAMEGECRFGGE